MIQIVPLLGSHKEPIRNILKETNSFHSNEIDVALELIDEYLNYTSFNTENYQLYTAIINNAPVGYVCFGKTPLTHSTYDLYWIAVDPITQGKGIGKKLFQFCCNEIKNQGGKLVIIETASQTKYEPTRKFYEKIGCTLEARIKNFYSVGDDKLIYTKHL